MQGAGSVGHGARSVEQGARRVMGRWDDWTTGRAHFLAPCPMPLAPCNFTTINITHYLNIEPIQL
jgi:hypothetical protein